MNLLLHIVHVFHILVIFSVINGYILFAANIEDFKTIAKKYIPERFAERLAHFASDTSLFNNRDERQQKESRPPIIYNMPMRVLVRTKENQTTESVQETYTVTAETVSVHPEEDPSARSHKKKISVQDLDIDELVERIKERLDKQYMDKYKMFLSTKGSLGQGEDEEAEIHNKRLRKKHERVNHKEFLQKQRQYDQRLQSNQKQYDQRLQSQQGQDPPRGDVPQFEEIDMTKTKSKDSYEDYIAPPKDDDSAGKDKTKRTTRKLVDKAKPTVDETTDDRDYDYKIKSSELKAVTENLNYDYHSYKDSKTSRKGTGIPTRERYTMSSPNYYVSIPIKAEKYDFNEPLPERDREHEDLKPFGNPPAKINKKVLV